VLGTVRLALQSVIVNATNFFYAKWRSWLTVCTHIEADVFFGSRHDPVRYESCLDTSYYASTRQANKSGCLNWSKTRQKFFLYVCSWSTICRRCVLLFCSNHCSQCMEQNLSILSHYCTDKHQSSSTVSHPLRWTRNVMTAKRCMYLFSQNTLLQLFVFRALLCPQ
jgi:hypothetical protein